jgi:hypothetical protein
MGVLRAGVLSGGYAMNQKQIDTLVDEHWTYIERLSSITTKPAGNALISIPTQFRLVANDLGFPGYVRVCQL